MAKIFRPLNRIKQTATYATGGAKFTLSTGGSATGYTTLQDQYTPDSLDPVVYWATSASGVWEVDRGYITSTTGGYQVSRLTKLAGTGPFANGTSVTLSVGPHGQEGPYTVVASHASAQSISNNALTTVTGWTEEMADSANAYYELPAWAAAFRVSAVAKWANATGGTKRQLMIRTAATGEDFLFQEGVIGTQAVTTPILSIRDSAGEATRTRTEVLVLQDTGGAVNVDVDYSVELWPGGVTTTAT